MGGVMCVTYLKLETIRQNYNMYNGTNELDFMKTNKCQNAVSYLDPLFLQSLLSGSIYAC